MKKVLIITYYWPPSGGAGVQRWLKFVKYLPEFGWEPVVYTPENPEAPSIDNSLLNDVKGSTIVIKRYIWEPYTFYKKFTGKKGNVNAGFLKEEKGNSSFLEKISVWVRGNFFIPDARRFWIKPSTRFLERYIKENDIEVLVTTGPPHSMHLIGLKLKSRLKIKWVADFRDPWTNIDFYKDLMLTTIADKTHHKLEKAVVTKADEVICIGKTMANEFEKKYNRRIHIITNGYDEDDFKMNETGKSLPEKFTITHVGSINKDRHHDIFWSAIKELITVNADFSSNLRIVFVGKNDISMNSSLVEKGLDKMVELVPYVNHNEVANYLNDSTLLYLPLNNTPNAKGVLTGKLFEYLSTGRQILSIGPADGDVANILIELGAGATIEFDDVVGCKLLILRMFDLHKSGNKLNYKGKVDAYSRKNLTGDLVKILG